MKGIAIIAAAGRGERAGVDKVWLKMGGKRVLERAAAPFFACPTVDTIYIVVSEGRSEEARRLFSGKEKPCHVVTGGASRSESVRKALLAVEQEIGRADAVVAIHDGARPYVTRELIERCMTKAAECGSAIPVIPCTDTLRRASAEGSIPISREEILRVQTPQCFDFHKLLAAYSTPSEATDDATLYERRYGSVALVEGDVQNEKITYFSDIYKDIYSRVGVGYDVHPLKEGRACILGGVSIPHTKGPDGHSDADVLLHAVMDALLTAAGLPDIGHYFPPDDPAYAGADSGKLLAEVNAHINKKGFVVGNLSCMIMAEKPRLAEYIPAMEKRIASILEIKEGQVSIAATTTEKLGIVGEEKGIAAEAVALLVTKDTY